MARIWTIELREYVGQRVCLAGWLHHRRRMGHLGFLILRDAKGLAQVVIEDRDLLAALDDLHRESVIAVDGLVCENAESPAGVELHEPSLTVIAPAGGAPPLDLSRPAIRASLPTILDHAPVALRHPQLRAPFEIASASMAGFRSTLRRQGFVEIQTPKIVGTATEGGASVFPVDYFGRRAYLAQSPQLYKQIMTGVFERVFEVGPVFRAEPHDTPRHLNEYVSMDVELAFIEDHTTLMTILTDVLQGMLAAVRTEASGAVASLGMRLADVPATVPVLHFDEALEMVARATGHNVRGQQDLTPADERLLAQWALESHGSDYLFVVGFPTAKRPFYTHPDPLRPAYSNSFDLLFRGTELVTGGQRLHIYDDYVLALRARGLAAEPLAPYLEAFKHGMPPHGGFAIGLERWVASLINAENIRQAALFPRDQRRLTP